MDNVLANQTSELCEILIVDDELKAGESLKEILSLSGYSVVTAHSVESAKNILLARQIQMVLLDLIMPVEDGHILLEFIDNQNIDTHVIIVSVDATFSRAIRTLQYDFVQEFIRKPYVVESLLLSIKNTAEKIKLKAENKRIMASLAKSEQMHRFFVQSSPDIIYMLNDSGEFIFLNNAIESVLGFNKNEVKGMHYSNLVYEDNLTKAQFAFNERRTGKRSTKAIELKLRCKNSDKPKYVETNSITIVLSSKGIYRKKDEEKEFVGTYGVIRDINDRKLTENTLKKLNLAVDNSPNLIVITDKDGRIEYVNPKITEITGYTAAEVIGRKPNVFKSGDTPKKQYQELWDTINSGKIWRGTLKNKKKNGEIYWSQQSIAPVLDVEGTVTSFIGIQEDVTEALKLNEQISYQATHDPLTNLINRGEFERRLKRVVNTAKEQNSEHALCYLDLDNFKIVNDTCNHCAGDELLRQISRQLSEVIRQRDTLGRLGGDEFGVLLEHCSLDQAKRTAANIHEVVQQFQFRWEGHSFRIGISIGLVIINADNCSFEELIKQADMACYMAKEAGRNQTYLFQESDRQPALLKGDLSWASRINQALSNDLFSLYAQTILPLQEANGHHYEIFIRLKDDNEKILAPGAFLPAADRYQLSAEIDQWVIKSLFNWYQKNPQHLSSLALCWINLSSSTLISDEMVPFIIDQFTQTGIPADKICFEFSETATISNLTQVSDFITQLKKIGCKFSLDDFGSGLSSFAYLKNLPVDFIKIDGLIVRDIEIDPTDLAMVKAINEIAHVMGKQTIAKFVENEKVLQLLKDIKVDYVQGHWHHKPEPLNKITA